MVGDKMRKWTLEERYQILKNKNEIKELYSRVKESPYRQKYHIQPVTGLLSDPNGFVYHQGTWHLFYQWCPWGAVHGIKYWYHVTSSDLVNWSNQGIGLAPDTEYDNKGVHSGSGFSTGQELYLFYTGNHRDENWLRTPYTCGALMVGENKFKKFAQPLFGPRKEYTEHQRDPKIVYNKDNQKYYLLLGARSKEDEGKILLYSAKELKGDWLFLGELRIEGFTGLGKMWECPSIIRIDNKDVLIFSPQYIKIAGRGNTTNHNIYFIGKMDYDNLIFYPDGPYQFLDYGFDFYAAQFAAAQDSNSSLLIGWIGLPDNHYSQDGDWEGSLSLPREVTIKEGKLYQIPVKAINSLRRKIVNDNKLLRACEIEIMVNNDEFDLNLFTKVDGSGGLRIHYDNQTCNVDKTGLDIQFNQEIGQNLSFPLTNQLKKLNIYIDHSSCELFFNEGEETFTMHVFPTEQEDNYFCSESENITIYELRSAVVDNFRI